MRANTGNAIGNVSARWRKNSPAQKKKENSYAAFVFEPLMQGAAGMIPQPETWLKKVSEIARGHGALLIADEVMTGFGRTNSKSDSKLKVITVCLPAGKCPAGFSLSGQGADWRLFADGRDTHNTNRLRRVPWRISRIQNFLPRTQLHGQPTRRGGRACQFGNSAKRKIRFTPGKNSKPSCAMN